MQEAWILLGDEQEPARMLEPTVMLQKVSWGKWKY